MGAWTNIAVLLSAKTKEGGLSVKPTEGLPFLLTEDMDVTFVPPILRFPRSSKVSKIDEVSPGRYLVHFEEVVSRNDAEKLEGHFCLVRTECLPQDLGKTDSFDVLGYSVIDVHKGRLGSVVRVEENPAHPLLVIESSAGDVSQSAQILVPVVDEFILGVDDDAQQISVDVPAGLLEL
ncbi:MAG: 16S rRNA processing protein RimM [Eggerthellaceae bacterium]